MHRSSEEENKKQVITLNSIKNEKCSKIDNGSSPHGNGERHSHSPDY
jgi:hypothetical protein